MKKKSFKKNPDIQEHKNDKIQIIPINFKAY